MSRVLISLLLTLGLPAVALAAPDPQSPEDTITASAAESTETAPSNPWHIEGSVNMTVGSKYIFQGFDYSAGHPVLQPTLSATAHGYSATVWLNHDLDLQRTDEVDVLLSRAFEVRGVSLAPGFAYFRYPHRDGWAPSHEVYLDASFPLPLSPTLSVHEDIAAGTGSYWTAGLSQGLPGRWKAFGVDAQLYYQRGYYDMTGFPSAKIEATASGALFGAACNAAVARYVTWQNGSFRSDYSVPSTWYTSLTVAPNF